MNDKWFTYRFTFFKSMKNPCKNPLQSCIKTNNLNKWNMIMRISIMLFYFTTKNKQTKTTTTTKKI